MEKLDLNLFKKQELKSEAQSYVKGGSSSYPSSSSTTNCESTWVFWADCETETDTFNDVYDVLPAANNISSR